MSKEHLFADWVSRLFGNIPAGVAEVWDDKGVKEEWSSEIFQDVLEIVCERNCNNGWMSRREQQVSPVLGPMIKDGVISGLPPRLQQKLATWAVKTAFVADYLQVGHHVIPEAQYEAFYRLRKPLPGQLVWIAYRNSLADESGRELMGTVIKQAMDRVFLTDDADPTQAKVLFDKWSAEGRGGYWFTFACGHFVCQVMGHTFPLTLNLGISDGLQPVVRQIWPVGDYLTWPPPTTVDAIGGLGVLNGAFRGPPDSTPV